MKISKESITVRELCENYRDDNDSGVYGYDNGIHKLCLRPEYQREYVFGDKQRDAVIDTVMNGYPLGLMYWSKVSDNQHECLDGQQRSISICQYVNSDYPIKVNGNDRFFHNLTPEEKQTILDYELEIRVCDGTEEEKLAWFKRINIAGVTLTKTSKKSSTSIGGG